jgi:hypothetical protein
VFFWEAVWRARVSLPARSLSHISLMFISLVICKEEHGNQKYGLVLFV